MAKKEKDKDHIRKRVETRRLLCTLAPEELQRAGARLAEVCEDISNEETSQKKVKSQLKAKLEGLKEKREDLATTVRRRADYKDVPVEVWFDYRTATVEEVRTDTGEVLATRAMSDGERQTKLFDDDGDGEPGESGQAEPNEPPPPGV